ncbi:hypothetical protein BGAL_0357g00110 [Botrytis galanthina]|uniref:Uncharacterized protein n=1 Tax=Botrytis galanthina TaxID=278940 RepID=A0A4S8QTN0_9HELO|nr:hypothetical protein BGAL_0357g00110 [Botrytis galanthina]
MSAHNSSRSQYTPITTAPDVSIEAGLLKDTQTSNLDPSSSITDAEKTKVENKDEKNENGKFERIRRQPPRDTDVIFDGGSDADVEPVSESEFENDFMMPVGDKGEKKSKFRKSLRDNSTIAPEYDGEEEFEPAEAESGSRPQSGSIIFGTGIENQCSVTGNVNLNKIEDPYQQDSEDSSSLQLTPTSTAEFATESDSQPIHRISAKTELDHGSASGEGADANHEAETASQAAAHLDSLDPMNPSVEQDDARRNASIRATIEGLRNPADTAPFHVILAFILTLTLTYLELILLEDDQAYFCSRPSTMALLNSVILLLSWEIFVLIDIILIGGIGFRDIRYHSVEEIPDVRLTEELNQLRFHRIRSFVTPFIAWIWFYMMAQFPIVHAKGMCSAEELGGGENSIANATAVAFVDSTSHVLLGAVKNATNATVKALMDAAAQD